MATSLFSGNPGIIPDPPGRSPAKKRPNQDISDCFSALSAAIAGRAATAAKKDEIPVVPDGFSGGAV
jgi:hypothetical protein